MQIEWGFRQISAGRRGLGAMLVAACAIAACTANDPAAPQPWFDASIGEAEAAPPLLPAGKGTRIEIQDFQVSYAEEFDGPLDVSAWGCTSEWIAHTPWAGDFGDAEFADPEPGFPFEIKDGVLAIEARKVDGGRWRSGMLSAWDSCNSGHTQRKGYFEARMLLPEAPGFWIAFWLIGANDPSKTGTAEIDVIEHHTAEPAHFSTGIIKHPGTVNTEKKAQSIFTDIPSGGLSTHFRTYGVEVTDEEMIFYLDRTEYWRTPMLPEFRQPFYMLLSFAVLKNDITADTPDSVRLFVDYIRAYQRLPSAK